MCGMSEDRLEQSSRQPAAASLRPCPHAAAPAPPLRRSSDPRFNSALQTLRVMDRRPLTGDSAATPRWIASLPFSDSDVSSRFTDKYPAGEAASGVSCWGGSLGARNSFDKQRGGLEHSRRHTATPQLLRCTPCPPHAASPPPTPSPPAAAPRAPPSLLLPAPRRAPPTWCMPTPPPPTWRWRCPPAARSTTRGCTCWRTRPTRRHAWGDGGGGGAGLVGPGRGEKHAPAVCGVWGRGWPHPARPTTCNQAAPARRHPLARSARPDCCGEDWIRLPASLLHRTTWAMTTTPAAPPTARPRACQPPSRCGWRAKGGQGSAVHCCCHNRTALAWLRPSSALQPPPIACVQPK